MADIKRIWGSLIVDDSITVGGNVNLGKTTTSGTARTVQAQGSGSDIDIAFVPKGTGTLTVPSGYASNITSDDDLVNRAYVNGKIAGKNINALVAAPTPTEDGYAITWDDAAQEYKLSSVNAGYTFTDGVTNSGGTVRLGGDVDEATTNVTQIAAGTIKIRALLGTNEAGLQVTSIASNNNTATLYGAGGSLLFSASEAIVTAPGAGALKYVSDYTANYVTLSVPHVGWVNSHIGGKNVDSNITAPAGGQDGYVVSWNQAETKYILVPPNAAPTMNTDRMIGRTTVGVGAQEEITVSNGLVLAAQTLKLGGTLTADTTIGGNFGLAFGPSLSYFTLDASGTSGLVSISSTTNAQFGTNGGANRVAFTPTQATFQSVGFSLIGSTTQALFVDSRATPQGLQYNTDYSANYTTRSLPDIGYVTTHLGSKNLNNTVTNPGSGQNGYVVAWNNSNLEYELVAQSGGSPVLTTTQIGFGVGGFLGGEAAFTYDSSNNKMTVERINLNPIASAPVSSVANGDFYYDSTIHDKRIYVNGYWMNSTRPQITGPLPDTAYTLTEADRGTIIYFSNACTVTLAAGLTTGFDVTLVKQGSGDISVVVPPTYSLESIGSVISTQFGYATFVYKGGLVWGGSGAFSTSGGGTTYVFTSGVSESGGIVSWGGNDLSANAVIDGDNNSFQVQFNNLDIFQISAANEVNFDASAITHATTGADYVVTSAGNITLTSTDDIQLNAQGEISFGFLPAQDDDVTMILGIDGSNLLRWKDVSTFAGGGGSLSGTGAAGRVAFWTGASTLSNDVGFEYDSALDKITVKAIDLGTTSLSGNRIITVKSSTTDADLNLVPQGAGVVNFGGTAADLTIGFNTIAEVGGIYASAGNMTINGSNGQSTNEQGYDIVMSGGAPDGTGRYGVIKINQGGFAITKTAGSSAITTQSILHTFTGAGGTIDLPLIANVPEGTLFIAKNKGSASYTIQRQSPDQIYETSAVNSIIIYPGQSLIFINDATHWVVV